LNKYNILTGLTATMRIKEIWNYKLKMDSALTSIVGPCHSLRVRVLQLLFLFLHRPVELPWWSRFSEVRSNQIGGGDRLRWKIEAGTGWQQQKDLVTGGWMQREEGWLGRRKVLVGNRWWRRWGERGRQHGSIGNGAGGRLSRSLWRSRVTAAQFFSSSCISDL
jgi:hypothetical protein